MNADQIGGLVRALIQILAGYLMAQGIGDAQTWITVSAGAASFAAMVWSHQSNKAMVWSHQSNKAISALSDAVK